MTNPTEAWLLKPGGLARLLKQHRERAGLTGQALGEKVGWNQSKVSKLETGKQLPSDDDLHAFAAAVELDDEALGLLTDLRTQADAISKEWRAGRAGGQTAIQQNYDELVRAAKVIRNAEVTTVPGLLQTREYARYQAEQAVVLHGFAPDEIEATLDAKMRRQDVLYDATKRFEFVVAESALRLLYSPPDVMLAQLDRLLTLTYPRTNLWFGIIPFGTQLPTVPQNRFIAVDDVIYIEDFADEAVYRGERASTYAKAMDLLMAEAVTGEQARRLILAASDALA
ncbi:helix-turn-helix transcriptional regulator [Dactylosporangium fulvum]|uniref:Helix-turn-helix domain-containing protein n=1 Tax=Dactylosporangium fulvum TaxID=53359 RepID=A0ABY5W6W9_9ACTN|nr:helix-turn-helix transcriptional regulator [Dactylosporangium fulvum]UWP85837.1 helix-turn-helix domain-containing protein [Dactylosporangium fulvum]